MSPQVKVSAHLGILECRSLTRCALCVCYHLSVIDNYQYRVDDPKMRAKNPDIKDFKRLNKVVIKEGGTNSMVCQGLTDDFQV